MSKACFSLARMTHWIPNVVLPLIQERFQVTLHTHRNFFGIVLAEMEWILHYHFNGFPVNYNSAWFMMGHISTRMPICLAATMARPTQFSTCAPSQQYGFLDQILMPPNDPGLQHAFGFSRHQQNPPGVVAFNSFLLMLNEARPGRASSAMQG